MMWVRSIETDVTEKKVGRTVDPLTDEDWAAWRA